MCSSRQAASAAIVVFVAAAGAQAATVPRRLADRALRDGSVPVLVEFDEGVTPEGALPDRTAVTGQRTRIAAGSRRIAAAVGSHGHVRRSFETVPWVALDVDAAGLAALSAVAGVRSIGEDELAFPVLDRSVPLLGADVVHASGFDGSGQVVVVLDTGVDADHPFLAGRVVSEACFSSGENCPNGTATQTGPGAGAPCSYAPEGCAHGTHVAGIAAGAAQDLAGVAPGADLVSIQIFSRFEGSACRDASPCAASYTSDQVAALERALTLASSLPIAAVNMSIGGSTPYSTAAACDAENGARKAVIDHLRSKGIATVVAAGNEGSPAGLTSPACISSAISVGATNDVDSVASFSNSASYLSLLAPGVAIRSSVPGGTYASMSGTSMAAPHVAGALALLLQRTPGASVATLLERLRSTGVPVLDARNGIETPRVSALAAFVDGTAATRGLLEFPLDGRSASGIGAFTGWLCEAESVLIRIDGGEPMVAAYGTSRNDTAAVCGDTDNGVSLLHNFNREGDGVHTAELIADGVVVSTSTYTVATLGVSFLRDAAEKTYVLRGFEGRDVAVKWLTERQGFEIIGVD